MVYEYAVAPEMLSNFKSFNFFLATFGVSKGRLISRYPKKWKRLVIEYLRTLGLPPLEYKRCEVLLERFHFKENKKVELPRESIILKRPGSKYEPDNSWIKNAIAEHQRVPFHAILVKQKLEGDWPFLDEYDLEDFNSLWKTNTSNVVYRDDPNALAEKLSLLLRSAKHLDLVDPHFGPENRRHRDFLEAILKVAFNRDGDLPQRVVMHTGDKVEANHFRRECEARLPSILPSGASLRIVRWSELSPGEKLHNRYIFTDIGGFSFAVGLDTGEPKETDDVQLLSFDAYIYRRNQYCGDSPAFQLVDEFTIPT